VAAGCRVLGVLGTHPAEQLRAATWLARSLEAVEVTAKVDGLVLRFKPVN
jgi:sugar-phosphatase